MTKRVAKFIFQNSLELAKSIEGNTSVLFYYNDVKDYLDEDFVKNNDVKKIIIIREEEKEEDDKIIFEKLKSLGNLIVAPSINFNRMNKVKIALMMCMSSGMLSKDENLIALTGVSDSIDTSIFIDISKEKELLSFKGEIDLEKSVKPEVFERILRIALELANQGREGKSIGAIFILGDKEKVLENVKQMIFNPFKGYNPDERNILKVNLDDTLKEFSLLDGAILIDADGVVESAGVFIATSSAVTEEIPKGLGSRHLAAASITALTNAISVVVSESTGDVTIFKNGNLITRIEKAL